MAGGGVQLSSPADVKALVPDFIFKRAKEVISSNKLRDVSFQGPSLQHSSATCTGSNPGDHYSLSIFINTGSSLNPTCQCSCPAAPKAKGNLCKHVVALLLLHTKELAKVAKDQANAAVLAEFKSAEERLFEARRNEPTLSDSQATEVFVPSDDNVDNDVSTTASSISPVMKNNQRRVLPTWISEGYCISKKEVKETNVTKAGGKKDAVDKEEVGGNGTSKIGRGKGKSRFPEKGDATKTSRKRRNKRVQDTGSEAEETPSISEQKTSSRAVRGNTRQKANSAKKDRLPAVKRRRTGAYVESDLSEEEDFLDDEHSFEAKEDLALTTEDLVNLATEVDCVCSYVATYA
ncbi:hypothetical protein L7F22_065604 [Adiantum nelumboides]|nr:hypothetical protein [Adiantum nelumboides]